jgi:hypothetical protein
MQFYVKLVTDIIRQIPPFARIEEAIKIKIWNKDLMSGNNAFGRSGTPNYRQIFICYHIYPLHHYI